MGYFPVRYDSRVVIYDHRGFIRLATAVFDAVAFLIDVKFSISAEMQVLCRFCSRLSPVTRAPHQPKSN